MLKKSLKTILLSAAIFTLAACSTTGGNTSDAAGGTGDNGGVTNVNAGGASATGVNSGTSSFGGDGQSNGKVGALQVGNQSYYFDFDKSDVHDSDMASVKVQANYLIAHPDAKVRLEGNTDNRGSREYNIGLGNRRALSVASALQMDGVSKSQMTTVSYGAEKPVALGDNEDAWSKNRRVDLIYTTPVNK